jgi:hypothetical protein
MQKEIIVLYNVRLLDDKIADFIEIKMFTIRAILRICDEIFIN